MSAMHEITDGPFAGTKLDPARLQPWRYASGEPVVINGKEMTEWTPDYLTPIFLRVFDPHVGWSVTTDVVVQEGLKLPDYAIPMVENGTTVKNSYGGDLPTMLQVIKVTAALSNPDGKVINSVSVLQGIHNINSAELGLKRALLQLYRNTGLPSSPEGHSPQVYPQKQVDASPQANTATVVRLAPKQVSTQDFVVRPISQESSRAEGDDRDAGADEVVTDSVTNHEPEQSFIDPVVEQPVAAVEAAPVAVSEPEQESTPAAVVSGIDNSHIEPRLLHQIEHFASLSGVEVRKLKDDADAKAELISVRRLANKR